MTRTGVCSWIVGLAFALPAAAMAEEAYTTTAVNLRAGPDSDYPLVRWLPEGTAVEVRGCLADYRWCDVEAYGDRGWVSASYLVYPYQDSNVPIVTYGPVIGLPLIGFTFESYWHDHYRRRPWYDERHRWAHRYRPDYDGPRYRQPSPRAPQYYPRDNRPPQYHPPSARPEFRPPQVRPQPMPPMQNRQPSFRDRDNRDFSQQPGHRPPQGMRAPMPQTMRPQAPTPQTVRPQAPMPQTVRPQAPSSQPSARPSPRTSQGMQSRHQIDRSGPP